MKYKFIKTKDPDNRFDTTNVTVECDSDSLEDVVEAFEEYLKACGFHFDGSLNFVEEE